MRLDKTSIIAVIVNKSRSNSNVRFQDFCDSQFFQFINRIL